MLAGPESLAGGNDEVDRVGVRRMVGRMDMEAPRADRGDALLTFGNPVGVGNLFGDKIGRIASEQRRDGLMIGGGRLVRQPRFEQPVVGMLLVDLAGGEDDIGVPVGHEFLGRQRRFGDRLGDFGTQFPASGHSSPRSRPAWRRSCWAARRARRIRSVWRSLPVRPPGPGECRPEDRARPDCRDNRPPSPCR